MSEWFEGDVIANGIKLHYHRTGGDKPALVIVHGITDMGITYLRLARALEGEYDVIMYDRRGHGLSEKPETGYTFEGHAADLVALITALGLGRPRVLGHSSGAIAAMLAASSHPDLMACLILEDPPWGDMGDEGKEGMRRWFLSLGGKTREQFIARGRKEHPDWTDEQVALWAETKVQVSPHVVQTFDQPEPPLREALARVACPILLITADPATGMVKPAHVQEMAGLWREGKVVQIEGAGHMIHFDRNEPFVEAVRSFLAEI